MNSTSIYYLGSGMIIAAIALALVSAISYIVVTHGKPHWLRPARWSVAGALALALGAAALLLLLFIQHRYDVRYVNDYSSEELEFRFRVAALWAGQPGSLVVWALVGLLAAPLLIRRTRGFEPYALAPLMLLEAALLLFMLLRNPFLPTVSEAGALLFPPDGRGLNPQLHNLWMVIHPPTLFVSYGLLGVMWAIAIGGLWRRDYDGWVRQALPWTVAGWGVLGLALAMGGYWAYESLGWGGYWGWDPVENASLVPWLTATALLHGLVLQKAHGGLRRLNVFLAILTYGLVFYASFLTRSGVLANFSVHSFVEVGLKPAMLTTMLVLVVASTALWLVRWRDVPRRPLSEALGSRDSAFVLLILGFVTLAVVISLGNSIPWISANEGVGYAMQRFWGRFFTLDDGTIFGNEPFTDGRFSFTAEFFRRTTPPLAIILVLLMSVAPLWGWRDSNRRKVWQSLRVPGGLAVLVTALSIALGVRDALSLVYVFLASLAIGTNLTIIVRTLRSGWLRIGGYLAHVGMGLLLLGVVGSYTYASEDLKMTIAEGDTQTAYGHTFTYTGEEVLINPETGQQRTALRFDVDKGTSNHFVAYPELFWNARMATWTQTPAIQRSLWRDVYLSPADSLPAIDPNKAQLGKGQEAKIGPYLVQFAAFEVTDHGNAASADVGASLVVTDTRTSAVQTLLPKLRLEPGQPIVELPVTLGETLNVALENFSPANAQVVVRVDGLNLAPIPAKAVVDVSIKPAIGLVWTGTLLMFTGAALAWLRRRGELALGGVVVRPSMWQRVGNVMAGLRRAAPR